MSEEKRHVCSNDYNYHDNDNDDDGKIYKLCTSRSQSVVTPTSLTNRAIQLKICTCTICRRHRCCCCHCYSRAVINKHWMCFLYRIKKRIETGSQWHHGLNATTNDESLWIVIQTWNDQCTCMQQSAYTHAPQYTRNTHTHAVQLKDHYQNTANSMQHSSR